MATIRNSLYIIGCCTSMWLVYIIIGALDPTISRSLAATVEAREFGGGGTPMH